MLKSLWNVTFKAYYACGRDNVAQTLNVLSIGYESREFGPAGWVFQTDDMSEKEACALADMFNRDHGGISASARVRCRIG